VNLLNELMNRVRRPWRWLVAQVLLTPLLAVFTLVWTRIPEKHLWQIFLTLLLPALVLISLFELEAGTMRAFARDDGKRLKLVWSAVALAVVAVVLCLCWTLLNWCDNQSWNWAFYLSSKAPASLRARLLSYDHLNNWIMALLWLARWVVTPAVLLPFAQGAALHGLWKLPWRRSLLLIADWRWWLGVLLFALLGVLLPAHLFNNAPHGSVQAQELRVGLKLAASFLLIMVSWILSLGWLAILFDNKQPQTGFELAESAASADPAVVPEEGAAKDKQEPSTE
jgi:hypothetical protein